MPDPSDDPAKGLMIAGMALAVGLFVALIFWLATGVAGVSKFLTASIILFAIALYLLKSMQAGAEWRSRRKFAQVLAVSSLIYVGVMLINDYWHRFFEPSGLEIILVFVPAMLSVYIRPESAESDNS